MIAAVCALAAVCLLLAVAVVVLIQDWQAERRAWADERGQLIDRVIAKHAGEVIAMDRAGAPKAPRAEPLVRPVAEGL